MTSDSRPVWSIPEPPGGWAHPWPQAAQIAEVVPSDQWTLIGGLMVQLHAVRVGLPASRATVDVDMVLHIERGESVDVASGGGRESGEEFSEGVALGGGERVGDASFDRGRSAIGRVERRATGLGQAGFQDAAVPGVWRAFDQAAVLEVAQDDGHRLWGDQAGAGEGGRGDAGAVGQGEQRGVLRDGQRFDRLVLGGHQFLLGAFEVQAESFVRGHAHDSQE
jgi:hypothetical protein